MKVKRIVANIETKKTSAAKRFYQGVLGLENLMDCRRQYLPRRTLWNL
jgi:catechol-2,3-dioxygenase